MLSQQDYLKMGFTKSQIAKASELYQYHMGKYDYMDILLKVQASPQKPQTDSQIVKEFSFDVLPPDQRERTAGCPVGLKNLANGNIATILVCYLNSLIQTYFHNPVFVREILLFNYPLSLSFESLLNRNEAKAKRIKYCINLVVNLQKLFSLLVLSNRKYVDPYAVFLNVVDEKGNRFQLGDQKDLAEFNSQLITCVDEGLKYDEQKVRSADATQLLKAQTSSQILQSSVSIISGLFYGKTKEFIKYHQNGNPQESEDCEQTFLQIIIHVSSSNLYDAWEQHNNFVIENYNINGEVIPVADKQIWIAQLPDSLLFQIQRVTYDAQRGPVKMNQSFQFEKEIFADRFMLENKAIVTDTQTELTKLKQKKQKLQKELSKYSSFQTTEDKFDDEEITQTASQLNQNIHLIVQQLQQQIDAITEQIESHYAIMKNHKFYLQSILIHEGGAEQGHYYAYIYNPLLNSWRKFDDVSVTEVTEEKVMKDAIGNGRQKMNAYCLIYQKAHLFEQLPMYTDYTLTAAYAQWVTEQLRKEVQEDNNKFLREVSEQEQVDLGDLVVDIYNAQYQQINEAVRKHSSKRPLLTNFLYFLRNEEQSCNDLVKWAILDHALRDAGKISLPQMFKMPLLNQRIKYLFDQMVQWKIPSKPLEIMMVKQLSNYYQAYILKLRVTSALQYISIKELADL